MYKKCIYVCMYVCVRGCVGVCVCVCTYVFVCIEGFMDACIFSFFINLRISGLKKSPFGQTSIRFEKDHHVRKTPGICFGNVF